jgi:hypothetical protein
MTNSKPRWVLALTATASFMVALDALVVATALSAMRTDLGASIGACAGRSLLGALTGLALPARGGRPRRTSQDVNQSHARGGIRIPRPISKESERTCVESS